MRKLIFIALFITLSCGVLAQNFTPKCEQIIEESINFYKNEMQGITDKGYIIIEFSSGTFDYEVKYNLVGLSVGNSLLALRDDGEKPALINKKYNYSEKLVGIDVLKFYDWQSFVFITEPLVGHDCKGQYEIADAVEDDPYTNIRLYSNNHDNALELEEVNIKIPFVYPVEENDLEDN